MHGIINQVDAGGKFVRGLANRRAAETAHCVGAA